jgi:ATP-binding cassette subfamily F protein uup
MSILLACQNLSKSFGPRPLFEGVSFGISDGERLGLIGPNGSGKSTLLKILAGVEHPDTGDLTLRKSLRAAYVPQKDSFPEGATVLSAVTPALEKSVPDEHDRENRATTMLERLGFTKLDQPAASLSGGWRKRLAVARELLREPDLLLMDEPTNHLDLEGILWLEDLLEHAEFACMIVTHDRYFLERVTTRVIELSKAYPQGTFTVEGTYSRFLEKREEFLIAQAKEQQALASIVRQDNAWLARGAKARRTKAKGRIQESAVRNEQLEDLKNRNAPNKATAISFDGTGRQTRKLLEAKGIAKSLGGKKLFSNLDLVLSPGQKLGLLGPNGSGKSTLIKVLIGEMEPDAGTIKRADALRTIVFTQHREALDPTQNLKDALCPISDQLFYQGRQIHVKTWAAKFLFREDQLKTSVGDLSGGEQARILIANLMMMPADLLILDEPTNDLDIASLEVLEESLDEFPGAVVLVTHDRYMLDRVSTDILGLDGRGNAKLYAEYSQWQAAQDEEASAARAAEKAAEKAKAAKTAPAASQAAPAPQMKRNRLSYMEQRDWDMIPGQIEAAEQKAKLIETKMADPAVMNDRKKMEDVCHEFEKIQQEVMKLYARWEELEAKQLA